MWYNALIRIFREACQPQYEEWTQEPLSSEVCMPACGNTYIVTINQQVNCIFWVNKNAKLAGQETP